MTVYALLLLHSPDNTLSPTTKLLLEGLAYFYAVSIVFGRLYCGMHGFLDVIIGSILGVGISLVEFYYGPALDAYMHTCTWVAPAIAGIVIIILVRIHPEPADDCPCFDDSVAFAGVVIGLEFGTWTFGKIPWDPWQINAHSDTTVDIRPLGLWINLVRIVFGVLIIFAWRETMKPAMLKFLPHLFRFMESLGWDLPRRFFTPASEYKSVPPGSRLDTLFPTASDFPRMVAGIRHPTTRGRSVSVGPQSAADAYETLAYRDRQRRESIGSNSSSKNKSSNMELSDIQEDRLGKSTHASGSQGLPLKEYEKMMGQGEIMIMRGGNGTGEPEVCVALDAELEEEMFSRLVKPRVRYDVEVVTKLVVYTGKALI